MSEFTSSSASSSASSGLRSSTFTPTSSGSIDPTTGFPFLPTFTDPTAPTATMNTTTTRSSGGGGGGSFNPNGPASSASLYLYTFLATLVLLLSVSGAIILRSLILRRRHRRLIEEAIANGTWLPPSPGGTGRFGLGGRGRVDLSQKPVMWEAYTGHADKAPRDTQAQTEWDWDSMRPFSASYVPKPKPTLPGGAPAPPAVVISDNIIRRFFRFLAPGPASIVQYPPTVRLAPAENEPPSRIKVAVLIAMPHAPDATSKSSTTTPGDPLASSSSAPIAPATAFPSDDEEELPHIEFGVAELELRHPDDEGETAGGKGQGRSSSAGGSLDV